MHYDLILPRKIVFGTGRRHEIGKLVRPLGHRAVLVSGSRTLERLGEIDRLVAALEGSGIDVFATETLSREPEVEDVDRLLARLRTLSFEGTVVIAAGGGAAIDLGKAVAALLPQSGVSEQKDAPVKDYLEGVGKGLTLKAAPLPLVALPTTAGTGAEATKNAVISSYDPMFKKSLRDDRMMPALALVDPEWTLSCPAKTTAESGMDAVTQLLESYVSKRRQPFTDALIEQGLSYAFESLPVLASTPGNLEARSKMSHAALLSGIALANAGLGMAHGVAPALGVHCRISHGAACALMLPVTLRTNAEVCSDRYARLARRLFHVGADVADDSVTEILIRRVEELCERLGLPRRLSDLGVDPSLIPLLARDSKGTSMSGNPKELTEQDVVRILCDMI